MNVLHGSLPSSPPGTKEASSIHALWVYSSFIYYLLIGNANTTVTIKKSASHRSKLQTPPKGAKAAMQPFASDLASERSRLA